MVASKNIKLLGLVLLFVLCLSSAFADNTLESALTYGYNYNQTSGSSIITEIFNKLPLSQTNTSAWTTNGLISNATFYGHGGATRGFANSTGISNINITQTRSISLWYYPTSNTGDQTILGWGSTTTAGQGFWINHRIGAGGRIGINRIGSDIDSGLSSNLNAWNHLVITYDNATARTTIYHNNVVAYNSTSLPLPTSNSAFYLGMRADGYGKFIGRIDSTYIFNNTLLTPAQVSTLYNSGNGYQLYGVNVTPVSPNFSITANDIWNSSSIQNFSANVSQNANYGNVTTIVNDVLYSVNFGKSVFNATALDVSFSVGGNNYNQLFTRNTTTNSCFSMGMYRLAYVVGTGTIQLGCADDLSSTFGTIQLLNYTIPSNLINFLNTFTWDIEALSQYSTTNGTITTNELQNSTQLFNISVFSGSYFNRVYENLNISSNFNAILTQSVANFEALSVMLNQNVIYDNITIGSQIRAFGVPFNISAGIYNATFQKLGWYNQTISIEIYPLTTNTYTFTNVHDAKVNLSVQDAINGTRFNFFTINVFNSTGFVQSVNTNQTYANASLLQGYTYTFTYQNESYFSASSNLAITNMLENLTLQAFFKGSMNISVINSVNLTLLNQNVTLRVWNTTNEQTYNSLTGRFSIYNLREGGTYNLRLSAVGFNDSYYTFMYGQSLTLSPYVTYMFPTGTEVAIAVQSVTGQVITNAVVNVSTFINGTRTLIASKLTDGVGRARFNLVENQYYVIDISADGFQTQTAEIYADQEQYLISLSFFEQIEFLNPLGGIVYNWTPTNSTIYPNTNNFSFVVTSQFQDLEIFSFDLYDENNQVIFILSSANNTGGTLTQLVDLGAYNNTLVRGVFFVKRFNKTGLIGQIYWNVQQYEPIFTTGGSSFRDFAKDNLSVGVRLALWGVLILILGLTLSVLGLVGYRLVIVMLLLQYVLFFFLGAGGLEMAVNSIITLIIGYNAIMKAREEFN
jgi:hypothetical protein